MPRREPARDDHGFVLPHDHAEILDDHYVLRHIPPLWLHDDNGTVRVASGAYSESSKPPCGMSVDLVSWMAEENIGPLHYIADPTHGATRIRVGALRGLGYQVGWDPLPGNPHHGEVWGNFNGPRRKRAIAAAAQTVKKAQGES